MGFIMTVYRRRLTSSFHAIRCSLQRRRDALDRRAAVTALLDDDDRHAAEGALRLDGLDDSVLAPDPVGAEQGAAVQLTLGGVGDLPSELDELDRFIADLEALAPDEPKMERLARILEDCFSSGRRSAVVFTQYADTLRYIRERLLGDAVMGVLPPGAAFERIDESIRTAEDAPMSLDDLDAVPEPAEVLAPAMTLDGLRHRLLSLPAAAARLAEDSRREGAWVLRLDASGAENATGVPVTFDRSVCATHDDIELLTWGSPLLDDLLGRIAPTD